ncbi:MAG: InlB B-repeat-containing protein, partial [Clostridia bacterium]|nr:InlB B-repeat-containing protein [Clostridia bacterium]
MKKLKRFAKRALSLVLCLAIVATTFFIFDIGVLKPEAVVTEKGKVLLIAPEAIYLHPVSNSWKDSTTSTFHYYIQNEVNVNDFYGGVSTTTAISETGQIYLAAEDGFSSVILSKRFVDAAGNTLGGSISVDEGTLYKASDTGFAGDYYLFNISGGTSPSLAKATTGCYIEWTVSYTNSRNERQSAIAYTYVYKPYVVPQTTAVRTRNDTGDSSTSSHLSWITGFHRVIAQPTERKRFARYTTEDNGDYGLLPFQTSSAGNINGNTEDAVGKTFTYPSGMNVNNSTGKNMVSYFASEKTKYSYFSAGQTGSVSINDRWPSDWYQENADTTNYTTFDVSLSIWDTVSHGSWTWSSDHSNWHSLVNTGVSGIYIDSSRYDNLNQVPNLGVGLMATQNEDSSDGAWYVADFTGCSQDTGNADYGVEKVTYAGDGTKRIWNHHKGYIARKGSPLGNAEEGGGNSEADDIGVKYSGVWDRKLEETTSQDYKVKMAFWTNQGGDGALSASIMTMRATQTDKGPLRDAVNEAIEAFGTLGVKENFGSYYYDTESAAWKRFVAAYKVASRSLCEIDNTCDVTSLVNELTASITALKNGAGRRYYFNLNDGVTNPNIFIIRDSFAGNYISVTGNHANDTIILNGSATASDTYYPMDLGTAPTTGDYTISYTRKGGTESRSNASLTMSFYAIDGNSTANDSSGNRVYVDLPSNDIVAKRTANGTPEPHYLKMWSWVGSGGSAKFTNFEIQLKIEKSGSDTAYSPAGRVSANGTYQALPSNPTRTGYIFGGWYTNPDCTGSPVTETTAITSDMLYAKWTMAEVLFGNEFDFDKAVNNSSTYVDGVDYADNSFKLSFNAGAGEKTSEWFKMTLSEDHTYKVTYDFLVNSGKANTQAHVCYLATEGGEKTYSGAENYLAGSGLLTGAVDSSAGVQKYSGLTFTVPTGKPYVEIRLDCDNFKNASNAWNDAAATATFSNIYVYDVTADTSISVPNPIYKTDASGTVSGIKTGPAPTRAGYVFDGWTTQRDPATGLGVNGTATSDSVALSTEKNVTVYSTWTPAKYYVEFVANCDGAYGTMEKQEFVYNVSEQLNKNMFQHPDKYFVGWNTMPDGSGEKLYSDEESVSMLTGVPGGTVKLYAQWALNEELLFGNNFDFDSILSKNTDEDVTADLAENTITIKVPVIYDDIKDEAGNVIGQKLRGENYTIDNEGGPIKLKKGHMYQISYDYEALSYATATDKSLHETKGQWHMWFSSNETFTGNGYIAENNGVYAFRENYSSSVSFVAQDEYAFIRWDVDSINPSEDAEPVGRISNIFIQDITYHDSENDGLLGVPEPIYLNGKPGDVIPKEQFPQEDEYYRRGYHIIGWSDQEDGNGQGTGDPIESYTITKDGPNKIYPIWKINEYTIVYDDNEFEGLSYEMSGSTGPQVLKYNETGSILSCGYKYEGHRFFGWNTEPDASGTFYQPGTTVNNLSLENGDTITLYAIWIYNSEVLFGNIIDFDTLFAYSQTQENATYNIFENSITVIAEPADSYGSESYLNDFGPYEDLFIQGVTYAVSYDFEV